MASHPLIADARTPTRSGGDAPPERSRCGTLKTAAAAMIGMLMRKLNVAALARSKDAGQERGGLREADQHRIGPRDRFERPIRRSHTVDEPEDEAHRRERAPDEHRRAKSRLGVVVEQEPGNAAGNRGDDEKDDAPLLDALDALRAHDLECGDDQPYPLVAKVDEHRHQRSNVQRDVHGETGLGPPERPRRKREMRGARDGEEFRETLQDAEHQRLKDGHCVGVRVEFMRERRGAPPSRRPSRA
jgi:hypothetical protein